MILWIALNVGPDPYGGKPVLYTTNSGVIQSPGYDTSSYPDNADCQWRITASQGYVRLFRQYNAKTFLNQCRKSLTLYTSISVLADFTAFDPRTVAILTNK